MQHKAGLGFYLMSFCAVVLPTQAAAQQAERVVQLGIICGASCEGRGYAALKDGLEYPALINRILELANARYSR